MDNLQIFQNLVFLIILSPILVTMAWNLWLSYVQTEFLRGYNWVLLEVKPPKEVSKSPLAMELVLGALYQAGGTGNWFDRYWKGNLRSYFSLEIVSTEGAVHFYIRTHKKFQKLIESQIYAQYPQAEVFEVSDYTEKFPKFNKEMGFWGTNLVLVKEDPYPIKTYIDYGLDRAIGTLSEEERIDPITPTIEFMGSIGAGEHIWFQIIVRAATDRFTIKEKGEEKDGKKWTDKAKEIIKELNDGLIEKDDDGKVIHTRKFTKGELSVIESIERNANKLGFDAGIRAIYLTEEGKFNPDRIAGLTGMLKQYNANDFNGFKPSGHTSFDLPWQDVTGSKLLKKKKDLLEDYKDRGYFYGSFDFKKPLKYFTHPNKSGEEPFILSAEELATLFHLPGRVAETPTFERIETKKADAPLNLPV